MHICNDVNLWLNPMTSTSEMTLNLDFLLHASVHHNYKLRINRCKETSLKTLN